MPADRMRMKRPWRMLDSVERRGSDEVITRAGLLMEMKLHCHWKTSRTQLRRQQTSKEVTHASSSGARSANSTSTTPSSPLSRPSRLQLTQSSLTSTLTMMRFSPSRKLSPENFPGAAGPSSSPRRMCQSRPSSFGPRVCLRCLDCRSENAASRKSFIFPTLNQGHR